MVDADTEQLLGDKKGRRMLTRRSSASGFSLIELMIVLVVLTFALLLGAPSFSAWMQNSKLRGSAGSILAGLQFAKSEAVARNALVTFQLVSSLDDSCTLSTTSPTWVVNLAAGGASVEGLCATTPQATTTTAPFIIGAHDGISAPSGLVVNSGGVTSITFNGLGRPTVPANVTIELSNPTIGACAAPSGGGPVNCMRVVVSAAGDVRMCNPRFLLPDPQGC